MTISYFTWETAKTGHILYNPGGEPEWVVTNNAHPTVGYNVNATREKRGYFTCDTTPTIPANAIIDKVEFVHSVSTTTGAPPPPNDWRTEFYIQDIGASLGTGDWTGGTLCVEEDWAAAPITKTIDLGSAGIAGINKTGSTTIRLQDSSDWIAGQTWEHVIHTIGRTPSKLKVEWHVSPQIIKVVGN